MFAILSMRNGHSQSTIVDMNVQSPSVSPMGIIIQSATAFQNQQTVAMIGLNRRHYLSQPGGSGNDRADNVGIWIKGYYSNLGESLPIYLGGTGWQNEDYKMVIENNGNVGIGIGLPLAKLDVGGNSLFLNGINKFYITENSYPDPTHAGIRNNGGDIILNARNHGTLAFNADRYSDTRIQTNNGGGPTDLATFLKDGTIRFGTTNLQSKFYVNGDIFTRKLKVTQSGWPDYVFFKDYPLMPINVLKDFIDKAGHLPDMPSASEVQTNGLDVGATQASLLKKVEELTLYIISLNKELTEQKNKLMSLEKMVSQK